MTRALAVVGLVAVGIVLVLYLGFIGLRDAVNRVEPARVAVVVSTGELMVVRVGVGDRPRDYLVPAQTGVLLPPGDLGTIGLLDDGCHLVDTVRQGGPATWQLVTVAPGGATVALSAPDATLPPLPEAEPTELCP
jgi:hypothetical protein